MPAVAGNGAKLNDSDMISAMNFFSFFSAAVPLGHLYSLPPCRWYEKSIGGVNIAPSSGAHVLVYCALNVRNGRLQQVPSNRTEKSHTVEAALTLSHPPGAAQ